MACSDCPDLRDLLSSCTNFSSLKTYLKAVLDSLCEKGCGGRLTTDGLNPTTNPVAATAEGFPVLRGCECLLLVLEDFGGNIYLSTTKGASWTMVAAVEDTISAIDPTVNEDEDDGFFIGSRWINTTDGNEFVCVDATAGMAVWIQTNNPPGLVRLASGILVAPASSISISGISQQYHDLILVFRARNTTNLSGEIHVQFNGDAGNNYSYTNVDYVLAVAVSAGNNQTAGRILQAITGSAATASYFAALELRIPAYYRNDITKLAHYHASAFSSPADISQGEGMIAWENVTDGIDQITLTPGAGNFAIGTSWELYGRGADL